MNSDMYVSGDYQGRGTNEVSGMSSAGIWERVKIFNYLSKTRGRLRHAVAMGHVKKGLAESFESLTEEGFEYWKSVVK
ncbi:MAG: hypothetical protein U9N61_10405 [Euryarchaeota archaeon]|nr:hypothetical protein [Euryarchaeota archaeon]